MYKRLFVMLILVVTSQLRDWNNIDYSQWCVVPENPPCINQCKVGTNCGVSIWNWRDMTNRQSQMILDLHNVLRNEIARGDYVDWHFPPATNIYVMNFDAECQFLAQCWIRQCNFWRAKHFTKSGSQTGQNLFESSMMGRRQFADTWMTDAIMSWFYEYKLLINYEGIYKKMMAVKRTSHFIAMMWHSNTGLGCAHEYNQVNDRYWYGFYCNIYPAARVLGSAMYQTAPYDCDRSKIFPHLCGEMIPLKDEYGNDIILELPKSMRGEQRRQKMNKGCILLPDLVRIMQYTLIIYMMYLI